jgi:hypothetical protein
MKTLLLSIVVVFSATILEFFLPAQAVEWRWTRGFGQGTFESIIRNSNKSSINIYCPSGQNDTTPGIFYEYKGKMPRGELYVQFVVDGSNHPIGFLDGHYLAQGYGMQQALLTLVEALQTSRAPGFTVEFPEINRVEQFSLSNARDALTGLLDGCLR